MRDSEPIVKADPGLGGLFDSDSLNRNSCKALNVPTKEPTNRDTVLSDFIRHKIREWINAGREQKDLAEAAGLRPSAIAMIKGGQGVGAKSAPGIARALGYESVPAMVDAAYAWRQGMGESLERRLEDHAFRAGAAAVALIMVPPTDVELRTIAADFVSPRFDGRDPSWWAATLGTELQRDRARSIDPAARVRSAAGSSRPRQGASGRPKWYLFKVHLGPRRKPHWKRRHQALDDAGHL